MYESPTEMLSRLNAVIRNSHVVYTSGKHGTAYIDKDSVYPHTLETDNLCLLMAKWFVSQAVEVVVAPAVGGINLSQGIARNLSRLTGREVLSVYAEREEKALLKVQESTTIAWMSDKTANEIRTRMMGIKGKPAALELLEKDFELVIKTDRFVLKRGYDKLVSGKNCLVTEDILNTGGTVRKTIDAVRRAEGKVIGVAAIANRGGVTAAMIGDPPRLISAVDVVMEAISEEECAERGACFHQIPINTTVGKGKDFLARKAREQKS